MDSDKRIAELEAELAQLRTQVNTLSQRVHELRFNRLQRPTWVMQRFRDRLPLALQRIAQAQQAEQSVEVARAEGIIAQNAFIHLERKPRYSASIRSFKVFIDYSQVATIQMNEAWTFEVAPGEHDLHLEVDWCSSPHVVIEIEAGQEVSLICHTDYLFASLFQSLFDTENYIDVYDADEPEE